MLPTLLGVSALPGLGKARADVAPVKPPPSDFPAGDSAQLGSLLGRIIVPGRDSSELKQAVASFNFENAVGDSLVTNTALIRDGVPLRCEYSPIHFIAGQLSLHSAQYSGNSYLRIQLHPRKSLAAHVKSADTLIPAFFSIANGIDVVRFGSADSEYAIPLPSSANINVTYFPSGNKLGRKVTQVKIIPDGTSDCVFTLNFAAFAGDSMFKAVKISVGKTIVDADGKHHSISSNPELAQQIDLNLVRKRFKERLP